MNDFRDVEQIRLFRPFVLASPLGERAERTPITANISVVDVSIDDERGGFAVDLCAQSVGGFANVMKIAAARIEQHGKRGRLRILGAMLRYLLDEPGDSGSP